MRKLETRDYQERIHKKLMAYIDKPIDTICKTILIQAPTGSGKSIMGLRAAKELEERGSKIGWIAHRKELLHQTIYANYDFFKVDNISFISLFDRNPEKYIDTDIVILDECLPGNTKIWVMDAAGSIFQTDIKSVVVHNVGVQALSVNNNGKPEFQPILNRNNMGVKPIFNVAIKTNNGIINYKATGNGKLWTRRGYIQVKDLCPGDCVTTTDGFNLQQNSLPKNTRGTGSQRPPVYTTQNTHPRISRKNQPFRSSCLVDGRRFCIRNVVNSRFYPQFPKNNCGVVSRNLWGICTDSNGQPMPATLSETIAAKSPTFCRTYSSLPHTLNEIQGGEISLTTGIVESVTVTDTSETTYDIGVYKNRNFFADGVLTKNCQHDATKSAALIYETIKPKIIIGLSATPYRVDQARLCFSKVIQDAGIRQLIMEGWLAPFKQWLIEEAWTPENVAKVYAESPERWGKSVVYFRTKADAEECKLHLLNLGVSAESILGDSPRRKILDDFETGKIDVLTNVLVLTEGFDCPSLKTVFVRPSSKAPAIQMCGRVFRKHPSTPIVNVVQSCDTKYPFTRHARAEEQWLRTAGEWRSIDAKNLMPIITEQRQKLAHVEVDIHPFIKKSGQSKFNFLTRPGQRRRRRNDD